MDMPAFLSSEFAPSTADAALFHIIPVPYEASVSYGGGAALGPSAILHASQQLEAWDGISSPGDLGLYTAPAVDCSGNAIAVLDRIERAVATALQHKAVPIMLGGEHTVTLGALRALVAASDEPFGIVQFDAHADLRDEYEGNIYSHASVMCRAVKDLGLPLVQCGCRDFCRAEVENRRQCHVVSWDAATLARDGLPLSPLPADFPRRLYITFDVDGLDASIMPATGTPSPGGLNWYDALTLLERCIAGREVVGCDVVELAPIAGLHFADFTAAKLTHAIMGMIQRSQS